LTTAAAAAAVFASFWLSCGSYKKFFVTVTGHIQSLFWTSYDAAYRIVLYCSVLFCIYLRFLTTLSITETTLPNIMLIYESWFDRDVKETALPLVLNDWETPPPSTPSLSASPNWPQRLATFLTLLNDCQTLCNTYKLQ